MANLHPAVRPGTAAAPPKFGMPDPSERPDAGAEASPSLLRRWVEQRCALVGELAQALHDGFDAVANFNAAAYLDCIEHQDDLSRRISALDCAMPAEDANKDDRVWAQARLQAMNAKLKELADVHTALIERGSRSVRGFQRVWAMRAPSYGPPGADNVKK